MEWIDGITLLDLARYVLIPDVLIEELIAQIQEGLKDLARAGLVHGDLSPANILIDKLGRVRLIDFGGLSEGARELLGTPAYMAPEIWRGDSPSFKSDLFALGLIEADLREGFQNLSPDLSESGGKSKCLERIEIMRSEFRSAGSWLNESPDERKERELFSIASRRLALAELVNRACRSHRSQLSAPIETRACSTKNAGHFLGSGIAACLILAFTSSSSSVRAQNPTGVSVGRPSLPTISSCLQVRSHKWLALRFDGREIGFAPLDLNENPGEHQIEWHSDLGRGAAKVVLKPGPCRLLDEARLKSLSREDR